MLPLLLLLLQQPPQWRGCNKETSLCSQTKMTKHKYEVLDHSSPKVNGLPVCELGMALLFLIQ